MEKETLFFKKVWTEIQFWLNSVLLIGVPFLVVSGLWHLHKWVFAQLFEHLLEWGASTVPPEWVVEMGSQVITTPPSFELFGFPIVAYMGAIVCFVFWYMSSFNSQG